MHPNLVQADELHVTIGCHAKRLRDDAPEEWGSAWTWLALDSESSSSSRITLDSETRTALPV